MGIFVLLAVDCWMSGDVLVGIVLAIVAAALVLMVASAIRKQWREKRR